MSDSAYKPGGEWQAGENADAESLLNSLEDHPKNDHPRARLIMKRQEQILRDHGIWNKDHFYCALLLQDPHTRSIIRHIFKTIDIQKLQWKLANVRAEDLSGDTYYCFRCGKPCPRESLKYVAVPGAHGQTCGECRTHHLKRNEERLERRGITSACSRARAARLPCTLTEDEWSQTVAHFSDSCAYCGRKPWYVVEHATPIEMGGGTTMANCLPSCYSCNSVKGSRSLEHWEAEDLSRDFARALRWLRAHGRNS